MLTVGCATPLAEQLVCVSTGGLTRDDAARLLAETTLCGVALTQGEVNAILKDLRALKFVETRTVVQRQPTQDVSPSVRDAPHSGCVRPRLPRPTRARYPRLTRTLSRCARAAASASSHASLGWRRCREACALGMRW